MKRGVFVAIAAVAVMVIGGTAIAATHKTFTIRAKAGVLNPGSDLKLLGGVTEGTFGEGAMAVHNKAISPSTGRSTYTLFTKRGSFSGHAKLTGKTVGQGSSGETVITGTASISSGTGAFAGATGSFRISGVSPANLPYFLLKFTGSITLP